MRRFCCAPPLTWKWMSTQVVATLDLNQIVAVLPELVTPCVKSAAPAGAAKQASAANAATSHPRNPLLMPDMLTPSKVSFHRPRRQCPRILEAGGPRRGRALQQDEKALSCVPAQDLRSARQSVASACRGQRSPASARARAS